jgi:hypothetical protein
MIAFALRHM